MIVAQQSDQQQQCIWLKRSRKNQPQWHALGAGAFIFVSGGMSQAWSAGFAAHSTHQPNLQQQFHMQFSWYIAALCGAIIFSACLVLVCGLLYLILPEQAEAIIAARYLDGLANGLVFVPTLSTVGELAVLELRGLLAGAVEHLSYNLGIFMLVFYTAIWQSDWNIALLADQLHGLLSIIYGVLSLALALTLYVETPVFFLLQRNEQAAIVSLRLLQRPYMVTSDTLLQLDEHKRYVAAQRELKCSRVLSNTLAPLLKLLVYRTLYALSFTPLVWCALYEAGSQLTAHFHTWPYVMFALLRLSGSCCIVPLLDGSGRKKPTMFGSFAVGATALSFATLLQLQASAALVCLLAVQFFASVAHTASAVYFTEAFPLAVKPFCVALVYAVELLIRLSFCYFVPAREDIIHYFYFFGGVYLMFFALSIFCLPETRLTTLTAAQHKLRQWFNKDF
ncbi:uncharacterized protein LOC108598139 [Drosophila busckii]|uniref:uncharacterized protein LOC108598139 n=1 Tax=Drosophila busckii TaxID=30019 RepID=UPI001432D7AF|nr:uncharacterized protein LOC108598139 [Drosophila busckii]